MKKHIGLMMLQVASLYGASNNIHDYTVLQSELSKEKNRSVVIDTTFESSRYISDWAESIDRQEPPVRAVALVSLDDSVQPNQQEIQSRLVPFFDSLAAPLLRTLKSLLETERAFACVSSCERIPATRASVDFSGIQSLAVRLSCVGLRGAVHVCYDLNRSSATPLHVEYALRDWYASLHLQKQKPICVGSVRVEDAKHYVGNLQKKEDDLHSIIFYKSAPLVLQEQ